MNVHKRCVDNVRKQCGSYHTDRRGMIELNIQTANDGTRLIAESEFPIDLYFITFFWVRPVVETIFVNRDPSSPIGESRGVSPFVKLRNPSSLTISLILLLSPSLIGHSLFPRAMTVFPLQPLV